MQNLLSRLPAAAAADPRRGRGRGRQRSRAHRSHQRGAALVEMVVVVPVFIILFAGMLFLHNLLAKMQRSQLAARNQAWTEAMGSCQGGAPVPQPDLTSDMSGAPGSSVSLTATPGEAKGSADDYASVSILGAGPSAVAAAGDVSFFQNVHAKATVMCNATTEAGNIPGVFQWFVSADDIKLIFGGP